MPDTRILTELTGHLTKINKLQLWFEGMQNKPEFKDSRDSLMKIEAVKNLLNHTRRLLKQLYQRAAAHALKTE